MIRRVMVIGAPGSGKSTLARKLGEATGLPVTHMDHLHYLPGWVQRPLPEKVALAREVEAGASWIFEGGLSATYDSRVARADLVVHLDLPLWRRLLRIFKRIAQYRGTSRPDSAPDCPERLDWAFLWWVIRNARRIDRRDRALVAALPPGKGVTLRSQADIDRYEAQVRASGL